MKRGKMRGIGPQIGWTFYGCILEIYNPSAGGKDWEKTPYRRIVKTEESKNDFLAKLEKRF